MPGSRENGERRDVRSRTMRAAADPITRESGEVVYDWDLASDRITWGAGLAAIVGSAACEQLTTGIGYAEHLAAASPGSRYEAVMAADGYDSGGGVPYKVVYGLQPAKRSSAAPVWIEDAGRWFADAKDRPARAHGTIRVITERYEADLRLAAAQRDSASGAFSRATFIEHVTRQLAISARRSSVFAVLLISIEPRETSCPADGKAIEAAVVVTLDRLSAQMRKQELLAQHATNRFAILLERCTAEQVAAVAERFIAVVAEHADADAGSGATLAMRARVGAVIAPLHARTPQALLQFAEEALETAHQPTSPSFVCYDPEASRPAVKIAQPSDEIITALNEGRVALALQPIVDAKTRETTLYEALVRIKRADGTMMLPDALVPSAEKNGLVALIDRRVLDLAFAMLTVDRKLALSINAAVDTLHETCWLDHLRVACKLRPDAARRLTIEITETRAVADLEATRKVLASIKPLGVKIAIDDFGSGRSSFRTLRQLPIDYLKIDGAFAQNLANSPDDRFFIRTLIDLARNLQIPTVVQWVEDEATATILTDWGVEYLQGHLFGKAEIIDVGKPARRGAR